MQGKIFKYFLYFIYEKISISLDFIFKVIVFPDMNFRKGFEFFSISIYEGQFFFLLLIL